MVTQHFELGLVRFASTDLSCVLASCCHGRVFVILQIGTNETVKLDAEDQDGIKGDDPAIFDSLEQAQTYAMDRFGPAAGGEYLIVGAADIP